MRGGWIGAALIVGLAVIVANSTSAQQRKQAPVFEHDPDLDAADQLAPSQVQQQMPAAVALPTGPAGASPRTGRRTAAHTIDTATEPGSKAHPARAGVPHVVVCNGVFAKDSSHQKLAIAFADKNVAYTQVDSGTGARMASVLFGKDPKRRLEVWWSDPVSRSHTHLIVINGHSDWIAPGGLTLGRTLAEVDKLNGKPFKLLGFNKDGVAALSDWDGGALATLPGGCKLGLSLRADPNAPASARGALTADREYGSADAAMRAVKPTVSEILVGY